MIEHVANGRFTVVLSGKALQEADAAEINLRDLIARALGHISALLPGPKTTITVSYARPASLIPQAGVSGFTNPLTARITAAFGATPQASINKSLTFWFPRDLAHEVSHSVRILTGPGFGFALLLQIISEGIATAFDQAAFPGRRTPRRARSHKHKSARYGNRHSPSSATAASTTCGCSGARASRTGPGSPSDTTSSRTTAATTPT